MSGLIDLGVTLSTPVSRHASFHSWIGGRNTPHLSTNSGADEIAFQGWRRFKEAFAPELVADAIRETSLALGRPVSTCIDPFAGSGTTALTCQFLGVFPISIEVNPFLADLTASKIATYDFGDLVAAIRSVMSEPSRSRRTNSAPFAFAPNTFVEPGHKGRFLFSRPIAERIALLHDRIETIADPTIRRLLRVLLASATVPVSNVLVSGKGRRYRRNWSNLTVEPDAVDALFMNNIVRAIYDLRRYCDRLETRYRIVNADSRTALKKIPTAELAVFSPPYPNSFDYTDVYNVELWTAGYLKSADDNRALRIATIRSHVQIAREFGSQKISSRSLKTTLHSLTQTRKRLWNRHIPEMVAAYFDDMRCVLSDLHDRLVKGGRVYMVVGDSRYGGVDVPVARILRETVPSLGYEVVRMEPFRSMRVSPQQGGKPELAETLLVLTSL